MGTGLTLTEIDKLGVRVCELGLSDYLSDYLTDWLYCDRLALA